MRLTLAVLLLLVAVPAPAGAAQGEGALRLSGAVVVSWHGRPGACEDDGLCGVRGVVRWAPQGGARIDYAGRPGHWTPQFVNDAGQNPVVRVLRSAQDGSTGVCVDRAGSESFGGFLSLTPGGQGAVRLTMASPYGAGPFSSGRCAGPLPGDVSPALPGTPFRPAGTMDLRSTEPFAAGPYAGLVRSTLRAVAGPVRRTPAGRSGVIGHAVPAPTPSTPRRIVAVDVAYRVVSVTGGFHASLRGETAPSCEAADACGATGMLDLSPEGLVGSTFRVNGARVLHGDAPYGPDRGLRDLRAGRLLLVSAGLDNDTLERATTETVQLPGEAAPCTDSAAGQLVGLQGSGRRLISFSVDPSSYGDQDDALRTRCPGPTFTDVTGGAGLLAGTLAVSRLAGASPTVVLRGSGTFASGGWAGERSGTLTITLDRTRVRVGPYQ